MFFSIVIGMIMAFRPNGIVVNGVLLRSDTASGNLNFYKGMEGFLESFPQAIYQISILLRSARQIGTKYNQIIHFIMNVTIFRILRVL